MSLTSGGPFVDGPATGGGEVICLHEYARLRLRKRECVRDDKTAEEALFSDTEREVRAQYARLAMRFANRRSQ